MIEPSLDHNRLVGEELEGVASLRVQVAEKRILRPREVEHRHRCGHADVDPQVAAARLILETSRPMAARCVDIRRVAEGARVDDL